MTKSELKQKAMILINNIQDELAANGDLHMDVTGQEVMNHRFTERMIDIAFKQNNIARLENICTSLERGLKNLVDPDEEDTDYSHLIRGDE